MNRRVVILIPALVPTGPVKGAIALANALVCERKVTLVALKDGAGADATIHNDVELVELTQISSSRWKRIRYYRYLLRKYGGRSCVVSISMCFSADMVNRLCRRDAIICSSVRGNLIVNYRMDYGVPGVGLAVLHLLLLRVFDYVLVMSHAMAKQVRTYTGLNPSVIGNFVDEDALENYRSDRHPGKEIRFVFVGSLTRRKQPGLLIKSVARLHDLGTLVRLDLIGDGPLKKELLTSARKLGIENHVIFHGHIEDPYPLVALADVFVLPSLSEGISRAALEALYLGTPCVLRQVDANAELVREGMNGYLFEKDDDLVAAMTNAFELSRSNFSASKSLLPDGFRQDIQANKLLGLVEGSL